MVGRSTGQKQLCNYVISFQLRLLRGSKENKKDVDKYTQQAKEDIALQAAATAWANGVPWAEALTLVTTAINRADAKAKPMPKASAKAKAKPVPKALAKHRAG